MQRCSFRVAGAILSLASSPAWAQSGDEAGMQADPDEIRQPYEGYLVLDYELAAEEPVDEECEAALAAADISREIVVCRERNGEETFGFDKEKWEREYAQRTQGMKPVAVDGSGIRLPTEGSLIAITYTAKFGGGGREKPLIIDIAALPEPPAGSDADRIARGLPPRNPG